jgi:hypothetical protein
MNDRDKVIEENLIKEQVNNMTLEELWKQILEYIVNHNTTENIFNYNSGQNQNGETSEQNLNQTQNTENNSEIEEFYIQIRTHHLFPHQFYPKQQ